MEAGERKKKSSRLRRRMRRVLALLSRPMRRRAARHVTDDSQQVLVSNEQQQPDVELELDTVASAPEVVSSLSSDHQAKKTIFVMIRKSFRRRNKSTFVADRKKNRTEPDVDGPTSPATSTSGLFETEQDRLIELVDQPPEVETRIDDDVMAAVSNVGEAKTDRHSSEGNTERQVEPEVDDVTNQSDDVTREDGGGKKKHRRRKRAKRYARRVCICRWLTFVTSAKGIMLCFSYFKLYKFVVPALHKKTIGTLQRQYMRLFVCLPARLLVKLGLLKSLDKIVYMGGAWTRDRWISLW